MEERDSGWVLVSSVKQLRLWRMAIPSQKVNASCTDPHLPPHPPCNLCGLGVFKLLISGVLAGVPLYCTVGKLLCSPLSLLGNLSLVQRGMAVLTDGLGLAQVFYKVENKYLSHGVSSWQFFI